MKGIRILLLQGLIHSLYHTYVAKGGNTATGTNAVAAIKAKDKLNVGISELLGKAPPPGAPTAADPPVATPLQFDRLF